MPAYVGRYAPSPTGPLHLGSLLAALASYLDARSRGGRWLLRIDDLDSDRVVPAADLLILETLKRFGLESDGPVLYQSDRREAYEDAIRHLMERGAAFPCGCTRREAQTGPNGSEGPIYPGTCRRGLPVGRTERSIRVRAGNCSVCLVDRIQGQFGQRLAAEVGDFVIRRSDQVAAYQLATVVDDAYLGVTDIVRGGDLLSSTPRQIWLLDLLAYPRPAYAHVPVLVDRIGQKLGKSTGALALASADVSGQLWRCLEWLGQTPGMELKNAPVADLLGWAVERWAVENVPAVDTIQVSV
ncbi:MAG: tRNA glutamyl-Q(34) synthetase GluQRS [Salinisphaera sp.]|nr:tRNA glutamyl-Q(34) synthetase GluQRS [Salinisphaera sp.]